MTFINTPHGKFEANKKLNKTAQEVYDKWLANKDLSLQPTLEQQITANTDYLLDVDFRLILVELGMY